MLPEEVVPDVGEGDTHALVLWCFPDHVYDLLYFSLVDSEILLDDVVVFFDEAPARQLHITFKDYSMDMLNQIP